MGWTVVLAVSSKMLVARLGGNKLRRRRQKDISSIDDFTHKKSINPEPSSKTSS